MKWSALCLTVHFSDQKANVAMVGMWEVQGVGRDESYGQGYVETFFHQIDFSITGPKVGESCYPLLTGTKGIA